MKYLNIILYILLLLSSCSAPLKIIKFNERKNELYNNSNLNDFLKTNDSPKIVLRIEEYNSKVLTDDNQQKSLIYLYNIMENELIKQGFNIKDRNTFNQIISKSNSSDLLKKELGNADLILEVVNVDDKIAYTTNTIVSVKNSSMKETNQSLQYRSIGASVEYRLILVKNNEIGGTYKFFYQPCPHGCPLGDFKYLGSGKEKDIRLSRGMPVETMQDFISTSIRELVYFLQINKLRQ